jgi:hypothetical protein
MRHFRSNPRAVGSLCVGPKPSPLAQGSPVSALSPLYLRVKSVNRIESRPNRAKKSDPKPPHAAGKHEPLRRSPHAKRGKRGGVIKVHRHGVFVEVEIGEIIFVAVAHHGFTGNEDIADFAEHDARFLAKRLDEEIFGKVGFMRQEKIGFYQSGVLGRHTGYFEKFDELA